MNKEELVRKWLNDDLNAEELKMFQSLEEYADFKKILDTATYFKSDADNQMPSFEVFESQYKAKNQVVSKKKKNWIWKVAAILVIGFGLFAAFMFNSQTVVTTVASEQREIKLPDLSLVTLNAASKISFDESNWDQSRTVKLKGEAYFKVEKGKTFDVVTQSGTVTVVGTQFNVKQRHDYFEVVCFEGKVQVVADTLKRFLTPGKAIRILNSKLEEGNVNFGRPTWMDNQSVFENVPFKEVLAEIERQFGVEVDFENVDVHRSFTGGFSHDDLGKALQAITAPMNMSFSIETNNHILIHAN
ncbi:DUF4974 domain-containing protein [Mangrovimonas sp. CR14]|uniref:FecR family protein n=1 Tax=Mangrovimonas sp. CR14 TaxID=2706120 RepID=UPI001423A92E|nr:FecR domain-containing protein [Mangrovimonas sp. CR14]NIK90650.1 DUF4974 domain-containing protein [Mangrovimonas sp. CR14]